MRQKQENKGGEDGKGKAVRVERKRLRMWREEGGEDGERKAEEIGR